MPGSGDELVEVAFAANPVEAEMIKGLLENGDIRSLLRPTGLNGPMIGEGLLPQGSQRVMVGAGQAEEARRLLEQTLVEEPVEAVYETANARHLEAAEGRRPRGYGLIGAYARIYLWALAAFAVAFAVFLLSR